MKLFVTWFTLIVLTTTCNSKKTALNNSNENTSQKSEITISYSANTRGFFQELVVRLLQKTFIKYHHSHLMF